MYNDTRLVAEISVVLGHTLVFLLRIVVAAAAAAATTTNLVVLGSVSIIVNVVILMAAYSFGKVRAGLAFFVVPRG